jgi:hypothetical protein
MSEPARCDKTGKAWTLETLHTHLAALIESQKAIIDERDRLYKERDESRRTAVDAALMAQKEQTKASFEASEKAIVKAEDAQREYNVRSNEFRGQLDDQAKTLMPRLEMATTFRAIEDKLEVYKVDTDSKVDRLLKEIGVLREKQSQWVGKEAGGDRSWGNVGVIAGLVIGAAGVAMMVLAFMHK